MEARMKQIVNAVVVIAVVLWLLFWLLAIAGLSPRSLRLSPP
jgi:hypothetical protein